MRGALLVGSIRLALHLVLPQIPEIERSLRLEVATLPDYRAEHQPLSNG